MPATPITHPANGLPVAITIGKATLPVSVTSDFMLANTNHGDGDANHHQASPPPLTGTLNSNAFTSSVTFTDHGNTLTVTLSSPVTATTPVGTYAITADHHGHQQRQLRDANRRQTSTS